MVNRDAVATHGAKGEHIVRLPVGTIVVDRDSGDPIAEVHSTATSITSRRRRRQG